MTLRERIEGLVAALDHNSIFNNAPCAADDFTHQPEKCTRCVLAAALVAEGQRDGAQWSGKEQFERGTLFGIGKGVAMAADYVCQHDNLGNIAADDILSLAAAPSLHKEPLLERDSK